MVRLLFIDAVSDHGIPRKFPRKSDKFSVGRMNLEEILF
jgi:hypothetical protein